MNKEIEIPVPHKKIIVTNGQLHPSTLVFISSRVEGQLITPIISLFIEGQEEYLYLDLSAIGAASIPCKLDFEKEVFVAFEDETSALANENLVEILTTEALHQNLRLLRFDLWWSIRGNKCHAVGDCYLALRQNTVMPSFSASSLDSEGSMKLATYFSKLPRSAT